MLERIALAGVMGFPRGVGLPLTGRLGAAWSVTVRLRNCSSVEPMSHVHPRSAAPTAARVGRCGGTIARCRYTSTAGRGLDDADATT